MHEELRLDNQICFRLYTAARLIQQAYTIAEPTGYNLSSVSGADGAMGEGFSAGERYCPPSGVGNKYCNATSAKNGEAGYSGTQARQGGQASADSIAYRKG